MRRYFSEAVPFMLSKSSMVAMQSLNLASRSSCPESVACQVGIWLALPSPTTDAPIRPVTDLPDLEGPYRQIEKLGCPHKWSRGAAKAADMLKIKLEERAPSGATVAFHVVAEPAELNHPRAYGSDGG